LWGEVPTTRGDRFRSVELTDTASEETMSSATQDTQDTQTVARWSVGGVFLEALATRNFDDLATTLAPDVRFRAMLPRGPVEWQGADAVGEAFASWFGAADGFELIDATVGEVGGRLHLSWRLRVRPAPFDKGDGWHVIEQQAYADAGEVIDAIDLLCSGFRVEQSR
jgi:hypothetical protein